MQRAEIEYDVITPMMMIMMMMCEKDEDKTC